MKNYAKVGGRPGRPAYRTASSFRFRKHLKVKAVMRRGVTKKPKHATIKAKP